MRKILSTIAIITLALTTTVAHAMDATHDWTGKKTPTIKVIATADMMAGYNVHIITKNFKWAPEHASQAHVAGEGHAHIYVDGVKVARVYGEWYHLSVAGLNLTAGSHKVTVNLNGNDHGAYLVKGKALEASAEITVK